MALSVTTEERLASAVAYLRKAGHEEEARAVEALLNGRPRRRASSPKDHEPVPITEAAEQLGFSPKSIRREIELGMLDGIGDASNGYQFVTRASLDYRLETQRALAIVAAPLPGEPELKPGEASLLAQMHAHAAELDRIERAP
jgi:hypothetical protein